jgi:hypothetical protein
MAANPYWSATTSEYGVGALTAGAPVHATFNWPNPVVDGGSNASDIDAYIESQLSGAAPAWGAPDPSTIYVLFLPSGVDVRMPNGSNACASNVLAWHTAMLLSSGVTVPYVVSLGCSGVPNLSPTDSRTFSVSGQVVEAATDPLLNGLSSADASHIVWQIAGGAAEVATACLLQQAGSPSLLARPAGMTQAVQRTWSNAAAMAGHTPCVPAAPDAIFFDAVPSVSDSIPVTLTGSVATATSTPGVHVAAGAQASVELDLFSDGNTGDWQVAATEVGSTALKLSLDKSSGKNGDKLHLSVQVTAASPSNFEIVRIASTLNGVTNNQYLLVGN